VHRSRRRPHGDLGAGHEADAQPLRGLGRLAEAGKRVMVGQRERADADCARVGDERGGRQRPVGSRRVAVQIDYD
jgi:hypothetical protein